MYRVPYGVMKLMYASAAVQDVPHPWSTKAIATQLTVTWKIHRADRVVERTPVPESLIRVVPGRRPCDLYQVAKEYTLEIG